MKDVGLRGTWWLCELFFNPVLCNFSSGSFFFLICGLNDYRISRCFGRQMLSSQYVRPESLFPGSLSGE